MTLTTVQDIAGVVAGAVDLNGEWPKLGGIRGNRVTVSQILKVGEKVRGRCYQPNRYGKIEVVNMKSQVVLSPSRKSNSRTLKQEFSGHHGLWGNATQVLLMTRRRRSQLC